MTQDMNKIMFQAKIIGFVAFAFSTWMWPTFMGIGLILCGCIQIPTVIKLFWDKSKSVKFMTFYVFLHLTMGYVLIDNPSHFYPHVILVVSLTMLPAFQRQIMRSMMDFVMMPDSVRARCNL